MKPGAGGKPQSYDSYGRYTGPRGGSVSLRDGSIRLFADGPEETDGAGGQPGTDNEDWRLREKQYSPDKLARNALAEVGSGKWYPQTEDGQTRNQCNIFVAEKLRESGAHVPNVGGYSGMAGPEASDWLRGRPHGRPRALGQRLAQGQSAGVRAGPRRAAKRRCGDGRKACGHCEQAGEDSVGDYGTKQSSRVWTRCRERLGIPVGAREQHILLA